MREFCFFNSSSLSAHIHHAFEMYKRLGRTSSALQMAFFSSGKAPILMSVPSSIYLRYSSFD